MDAQTRNYISADESQSHDLLFSDTTRLFAALFRKRSSASSRKSSTVSYRYSRTFANQLSNTVNNCHDRNTKTRGEKFCLETFQTILGCIKIAYNKFIYLWYSFLMTKCVSHISLQRTIIGKKKHYLVKYLNILRIQERGNVFFQDIQLSQLVAWVLAFFFVSTFHLANAPVDVRSIIHLYYVSCISRVNNLPVREV